MSKGTTELATSLALAKDAVSDFKTQECSHMNELGRKYKHRTAKEISAD